MIYGIIKYFIENYAIIKIELKKILNQMIWNYKYFIENYVIIKIELRKILRVVN